MTREPFRNTGRITHVIDSGRLFAVACRARSRARPRDDLRQPGDEQDCCDLLDARGFKMSPRIGVAGDYVIERAFVEVKLSWGGAIPA